MTLARLQRLQNLLETEFASVLDFWVKYSIDTQDDCGGYFNCIDHDGNIYDTTKYVWLQCRAVYMFSRICISMLLANGDDSRANYAQDSNNINIAKIQEMYKYATHGLLFITNNVIFKDKNTNLYRCYFSVDRKGRGIAIQRKIFSECFFALALIAYASMMYKITEMQTKWNQNIVMVETQTQSADYYLRLAIEVFQDIQKYIQQPALLGFSKNVSSSSTTTTTTTTTTNAQKEKGLNKRNKSMEPLNQSMICLNIIDECLTLIPAQKLEAFNISDEFQSMANGYISNIIKHIDFENKCLRENVLSDGSFDNETSNGRILCPGHEIECAWFLRQYCMKHNIRYFEDNCTHDMHLLTESIFVWAMNQGWFVNKRSINDNSNNNSNNNGILYFTDCLPNCPRTELEWNMRLWWPINEAMVASIHLFRDTTDLKYLNWFEMIVEYAVKHLSDSSHNGAWYGYLDSQSKIALSIKGGPYKGFFHVPRALLFCIECMQQLCQTYAVKSKL